MKRRKAEMQEMRKSHESQLQMKLNTLLMPLPMVMGNNDVSEEYDNEEYFTISTAKAEIEIANNRASQSSSLLPAYLNDALEAMEMDIQVENDEEDGFQDMPVSYSPARCSPYKPSIRSNNVKEAGGNAGGNNSSVFDDSTKKARMKEKRARKRAEKKAAKKLLSLKKMQRGSRSEVDAAADAGPEAKANVDGSDDVYANGSSCSGSARSSQIAAMLQGDSDSSVQMQMLKQEGVD